MISQKCPKCLSSRVRRGYRPTSFWSKILFRYNLLCDNCNWEFTGFAVPGTVSAKPTKSPKKKQISKPYESLIPDESLKKSSDNSDPNLQIPSAENAVLPENPVVEESAEEKTSVTASEKKSVQPKQKKAKRKSGV